MMTTLSGFEAVARAALDSAQPAPRISIAVCDAGGHLVFFYRAPGALLAATESAQSKARTAVYFGTETRHLPAATPITPALLAAASVPLAFLPGGVPLRDAQGAVVGAVGVGGGTPETDQAAAAAAAAAWAQLRG